MRARSLYMDGYKLLHANPCEALVKLDQSLEISRESGDRRAEAITLNAIGVAYFELGHIDDSLARLQEAAAVARKAGDSRTEGHALNEMGAVYDRLGLTDEAQEHFAKAIGVLHGST